VGQLVHTLIPFETVLWLGLLVTDLSLWMPGFSLSTSHVGFIVTRVAPEQFFSLQVFQISLISSHQCCLLIHSSTTDAKYNLSRCWHCQKKHSLCSSSFLSSLLSVPQLLITFVSTLNPLNAELNPICHLLALLGAHQILHVSRIRVNDILHLVIECGSLQISVNENCM